MADANAKEGQVVAIQNKDIFQSLGQLGTAMTLSAGQYHKATSQPLPQKVAGPLAFPSLSPSCAWNGEASAFN